MLVLLRDGWDGFEEKDAVLGDPAPAEVDFEPAVCILLLEADWGSAAELEEVVLRPGLAEVGGDDEAGGVGRGRGVMAGEDEPVLDDHVGGFVLGVEELGVFGGVGEVFRGAGKDAPVPFAVSVRPAIGIGSPVELAVDKVDSAGFVSGIVVHGNTDFPVPGVGGFAVCPAEPVAFVASVGMVFVPSVAVEGIFSRVVGYTVDVAANGRIVRVSKELRAVFIASVLAEGVGDLDRFTVVRGVVDVDGDWSADDVAVVSPDEHFLAVDLPGVDSVQGMEIPTGGAGVGRGVGDVVFAVQALDGDLAVGLEFVRAEVELVEGGEEDVSVAQDDTECDLGGFREVFGVGPGLAVVFGK